MLIKENVSRLSLIRWQITASLDLHNSSYHTLPHQIIVNYRIIYVLPQKVLSKVSEERITENLKNVWALSRCSRTATAKKCTKKRDARAELLFCQS